MDLKGAIKEYKIVPENIYIQDESSVGQELDNAVGRR